MNILWENPNEIFGQPNTKVVNFEGSGDSVEGTDTHLTLVCLFLLLLSCFVLFVSVFKTHNKFKELDI